MSLLEDVLYRLFSLSLTRKNTYEAVPPLRETHFSSHKTEQVIHGSQKYSASEAMRKPRQSEALRRATSLSTITWKHDVPEKRVCFPFPVPVPFPFPLFPEA
jgi:hypothetical protein